MNENLIGIKNISLQQDIIKICQKEFMEFFKYPNVVGVGLGYKEINNNITDVLCLKVMVTEKIRNLSKESSVPKYYKNICTDIIQTGKIYACGFKTKIRPMMFGYSISTPKGDAGTACCMVTRGRAKSIKFYILGTNHVMASLNTAELNSPILQPAISDGGSSNDIVASLTDYRKIDFTPKAKNLVDAAIAEIKNINLVTPEIAYMLIPKSVANVSLSEVVQKSGQSSGFTLGTIRATNITVNISYSSTQSANFSDQILTTNIGNKGDSGAAIMTLENRLAGMLIGTSGDNSVVTPIRNILNELKVDLYTQFNN